MPDSGIEGLPRRTWPARTSSVQEIFRAGQNACATRIETRPDSSEGAPGGSRPGLAPKPVRTSIDSGMGSGVGLPDLLEAATIPSAQQQHASVRHAHEARDSKQLVVQISQNSVLQPPEQPHNTFVPHMQSHSILQRLSDIIIQPK